MRYFILLDFQHMVLALFLGLLTVLAVYVAWYGYPVRKEQEKPVEDPIFGGQGQHHPVPPLLVLIYVGTILWLLGYVLVMGIFGGAVS